MIYKYKTQGRQEGRQEGETQLVLRQLQRRLGSLDDTVKQQIQMLPVQIITNSTAKNHHKSKTSAVVCKE